MNGGFNYVHGVIRRTRIVAAELHVAHEGAAAIGTAVEPYHNLRTKTVNVQGAQFLDLLLDHQRTGARAISQRRENLIARTTRYGMSLTRICDE